MARKHSRSRASTSGASTGDSTAAATAAAAGALLHDSSGAFAGLEARRSKLLERERGSTNTSSTGVRRAAKCCDCGKLGTVQACSKTGCRSGFCAGCWSSLPQGEQVTDLFNYLNRFTSSYCIFKLSVFQHLRCDFYRGCMQLVECTNTFHFASSCVIAAVLQ
jgi:hypothetical protein